MLEARRYANYMPIDLVWTSPPTLGATAAVGIYPSIRALIGAMDAGAPRTRDG